MSDELGLALVGLGPRGRQGWLPCIELVPGARLRAVCDAAPSVLAAGAEQAGLSQRDAYLDLDDLLARDDVDAVVISVAPEAQAEIAIKALEAGKHTLCEVPLSYSVEESWQMILAAEKSGLTLALAEQVCQSPFARAWKASVAEGRLGQILLAEAEYLHEIPESWYWIDSSTGGPLGWEEAQEHPRRQKTRFWTLTHPAWYNPHSLSPLLYVLDDRVVSVSGRSTGTPSQAREDLPVADLEVALAVTDRGTIIRIATGFVAPSPHPWHWYRVKGTSGEVETTRESESGVPDGTGFEWFANTSGSAGRARVRWDEPDRRFARLAATSGHNGLDFYALDDFVDSIASDRAPTVDMYRAAEIAAVGILAGRSAENEGRPENVPDFRPSASRSRGELPDA